LPALRAFSLGALSAFGGMVPCIACNSSNYIPYAGKFQLPREIYFFLEKRAREKGIPPFSQRAFLTAAIAAAAAAPVGAVAAICAAAVGLPLKILIIAQVRGREQGQTEEFIAYGIREFLAGRNGAESVAGHHDLHLCQRL
jgi:hypothetical protein